MKKPSLLFTHLFAFLLVAATGCKPKKASNGEGDTVESTEETGAPFQDEHNSRNSLDWNGVYQGTLPCADCEGIRVRLTLIDTGEFDRTLTYLGKEAAGRSDSGTFQWNEAGSKITLNLVE